MNDAIGKMAIFALFFALWTIVPTEYSFAGPLPVAQIELAAREDVRTDVEIYRRESLFPSYKSRMIELCRRLEENTAPYDQSKRTDVEIYRKETGPGMTEYRREYRESGRFADPAGEERTLELCRRLQRSDSSAESSKREVHIYRESIVPR